MEMSVGEWRGVAFFRDAPVGANRHSRREYTRLHRLGGPDEPPPVGEPEQPPEPEEEEGDEDKEAARAV
jgi:hypothetical protein